MSEMVDRMTAIIQDWRENGGSSSGCARDLLAAIREPTEAMVQAGYDECEHGTDREMVAEAWRAMCDEMLK